MNKQRRNKQQRNNTRQHAHNKTQTHINNKNKKHTNNTNNINKQKQHPPINIYIDVTKQSSKKKQTIQQTTKTHIQTHK